MANLFTDFRSCFPHDGRAVFLQTADGECYSFGELVELVGRFSRLLVDEGVRPGDRIAVQVDKSPESVALYLACLNKGAVYLPLNTAYQPAELEYFFDDAEPSMVVCRPGQYAAACGLAPGARVLTLGRSRDGGLMDRSRELQPDLDPVRVGEDDVVAILYTSGTTGRSKGAMLTYRNLSSNALSLHAMWGWRPGDVLLHGLPLFHVHGLFVALHCALLNGSKLMFLPRFDTDGVIDGLARATVFMGVPTYYTRLLADDRLDAGRCKRMRLFTSGSAPLAVETFRRFEKRTGHAILERYGMTEAGMITSNPLNGERRPGTVGFPLPEVTLRIVDDQGHEVAPGDVGGVEIRGPNVFKGYWKRMEKRRTEITEDGYFVTGDLATRDQDGYISIVGRATELVISGGYNVYPKEVETYIDELEGVVESAVFGVPHPDLGEAVAAAVQLRDGAEMGGERIIQALKSTIASFKVPKRVLIVSELPRNAMGKVQKSRLREVYKDLYKETRP